MLIGSRFFSPISGYSWGCFAVDSGKIINLKLTDGYDLNGGFSASGAVRPVVEIDLDRVEVLRSGSGQNNSPFQLEVKS